MVKKPNVQNLNVHVLGHVVAKKPNVQNLNVHVRMVRCWFFPWKVRVLFIREKHQLSIYVYMGIYISLLQSVKG